MKSRRLGTTGIELGNVGLGCMGFSHAYGTATKKEEAIKAIRYAYEIGYRFFDPTECYIGKNEDGTISYNEEVVVEALKDVRDQVVIATKYGVHHEGDQLVCDARPETMRRSLMRSLQRLQTDSIDLYYLHRIDPNVGIAEVAYEMKAQIEAGWIKAWGISEVDEETLRKAHAICPVSAIQNRYSMMARWHEDLFPICKELGITYIAFSPMANGLLTGAFNQDHTFTQEGDFRARMPQFTEEGMKENEQLLDLVSRLAKEKNATMGQIALAWMINKEDFIVPIPGSRKESRILENYEAGQIEISQEEIEAIDEALDHIPMSDVFGGSSIR